MEIGKIEAGDADSGDYGKITYLLDRISSLVRLYYLFFYNSCHIQKFYCILESSEVVISNN